MSTQVMNVKTKLFCIICESGGMDDGPIIMECDVTNAGYKAVHERAQLYADRWGPCIIVELPVFLENGAIFVDDANTRKVARKDK